MDADVRAAVLKSHLHELPSDVIDELVTGAIRVKIPAGSVTHREGEPGLTLELMISGVVLHSLPAGYRFDLRRRHRLATPTLHAIQGGGEAASS